MKNSIFLVAVFISYCCPAQNVMRIDSLKDAWDISYNFCGEVKDKKPNGMGVAHYSSGDLIRYVGSFQNGMFSGKGVMFFKSGAFLSGDWKMGKLNGKGTDYNAGGLITIGNYSGHTRNGRCVLWYTDNSIFIGNFVKDQMEGRGIFINATGTVLSDSYYAKDKKNGAGYQYELDSKKLFTGEWKDGNWVKASSNSFYSFLSNSELYGEKTDKQVLIGALTSTKMLKDTAFYYSLDNKKKYFGDYIEGDLRHGIISRDDSSFFMGALNKEGATGYGYDFKKKKYYVEGNYINDRLDGKVWDIGLDKQTLYAGDAINGVYTGKAYFFSTKGTMYAGDYLSGKFTGKGFKIDYDGTCITGTWKEGSPTDVVSIATRNAFIPGKPKTFDEALSIITTGFLGIWEDISGDVTYEGLSPQSDEDDDLFESYVTMPGSIGPNTISVGLSNLYNATFISTGNFALALAKYNEIAAKLKAARISMGKLKAKLEGNTEVPDKSKSITTSEYAIVTTDSMYSDFKVYLNLHEEDGEYKVDLSLGAVY